MDRLRRAIERLGTALAGLGEVSNISHVGYDLHYVVHCGALGRQKALNLVVGIMALACKVC